MANRPIPQREPGAAVAEPGRRAGEYRPGVGLSGLAPWPWLRSAIEIAGLAVVVWALAGALPDVDAPGTKNAFVAAIGVGAVAWLTWTAQPWLPAGWSRPGRTAVRRGALVAMAAAGGVASAGNSIGGILVGVSGAALAVGDDLLLAVAMAAAAPVAYALAAHAALPGRLVLVAAVALVGVVSGATRRQVWVRTRQTTLVATATARADVARREAELADERVRLARELHDVLAHTLSALAVHLTAVEALARADPLPADEVRERVTRARVMAAQGLDEARRAVRALREESQPFAGRLEQLVAGRQDVVLSVSGQPWDPAPDRALAMYRVLQEALTNATRHGSPGRIDVAVRFEPGACEVVVTNPLSGAAAAASSRAGYGLTGMIERMLLVDGGVDAGPRDGCWRVAARVPR